VLRLRTQFSNVTSATTVVPVSMPYTIHCDTTGGTVDFGYGNNVAAVRIFAMSGELLGRSRRLFGQCRQHCRPNAANKLCARITENLRAITKAQ
jgi:hypothetical protein